MVMEKKTLRVYFIPNAEVKITKVYLFFRTLRMIGGKKNLKKHYKCKQVTEELKVSKKF